MPITETTTMQPDETQPNVRKMKSDRERDGKRRPHVKARTRKRQAERAIKRGMQRGR